MKISFWGMLLAGLMGMAWMSQAYAASRPLPPEVLHSARYWAIQHNGRLKPLDSFAREVLSQLSGSARVQGQDAVQVLLSILAEPEVWQQKSILHVPYGPLREALGLDPHQKHVSYEALLETKRLMRMLPPIVQKQQRDEHLSMLENETLDMFNRFTLFSAIVEHKLALVPPVSKTEHTWRRIVDPTGSGVSDTVRQAWSHWILALRQADAPAVHDATQALGAALAAVNASAYPEAWRLKLEVFYNQWAPFFMARVVYLLAVLWLMLLVAFRKSWAFVQGMGLLTLAFIIHTAGIGMRVIIGNRPPVSNFYETMLWIPFIAVLLALIFEKLYRVGFFGLSAALLGAVVLQLADYLPLDSSISPVVAVLRSNLWLTIHVLTIVASYGALALSVVMAHIYALMYVQGRSGEAAMQSLETFFYRALQVGVVLLAAGIILGGVWANASWGRYWGWDPKETWALITLLWYVAMLHGRFAGWIRGIRFALVTIAGFFLLLMTYYGVSFYLVGLHSYAGASAKPVPPLLIGYVLAEVAFIAFVSIFASRRRAR